MEKTNFSEILDVFETGTELNLGIFPNTHIVKYGYSCINNEFILYLQGVEKIDTIKNYVNTNESVNFNKYSSKGKMVSGDGTVTILETKEEKINGLKYIMKQQTETGNEYNINENELDDLFVFKILVENIYKIL